MALLFSYSVLLIDLLAAPLLLWRPTRYWMLSVLLLFHFMNEQLFSIGVFPVLASALAAVATYLALQTLLPLRHWLYPGNVSWTEEGHRYAWHMKLRDKDCTATFELVTPNESWDVEPLDYLTYRQARKMPNRPYMSVQFARRLFPGQSPCPHRPLAQRPPRISSDRSEGRSLTTALRHGPVRLDSTIARVSAGRIVLAVAVRRRAKFCQAPAR